MAQRRAFTFAVIWLFLFQPETGKSQQPIVPTNRFDEPTPLQDDANLNGIQFVGSHAGWVVADRGVIWRTMDAGRTWQLLPSPVDCPLKSLCFLTDRVGWIVGGGTTPFTHQGYGVVLHTSDGGLTWQRLAHDELPRLHYVRFWDLRNGVVVGDATAKHPTGVFMTSDGGQTWDHVPGERSRGWRTADFIRPDVGVVAGMRGQVRLVGGRQLLHPRLGDLGLRGLRSVQFGSDDSGWLVGDGGLVLRTDSGGVVWQPAELPRALRDIVDFRAVVSVDRKVWIAGCPGSVIWHTDGHSWIRQFTGQPLPIHALTFQSETHGWAVGALGLIMQTVDGGQTWKVARGGDRRVAVLSVHARPDRISWRLLAKWSGDLGYRSTVSVLPRWDVGPEGQEQLDLALRLHDATTVVGGSTGEVGWRFPMAIPGLERNQDNLLTEWNRQTEGRLAEVLLGRLVCQIRTWRPNIVVVDQQLDNDAATGVLKDALLRAIVKASDPTSFIEHSELAGLSPWQVDKIYLRLPEGIVGDVNIEPYEVLPRSQATVEEVASRASAILALASESSQREAYRLIYDRKQSAARVSSGGTLFSGIVLAPGSPARRMVTQADSSLLQQQHRLARKRRNVDAYITRLLDDPVRAAQLIGELESISRGLSRESAIGQLLKIEESYRKHSRWELVAATRRAIVDRFPNEPAAHDSMRWLLQYWSSDELAWQRSRRINLGRRSNTAGVQNWSNSESKERQQQAIDIAKLISRHAPALYGTPDVEFPLAALLRKRASHRLADNYYRGYQNAGTHDAWKQTAQSELWLSQPTGGPPKSMLSCRPTMVRPVLDGILSDSCWQVAQEIPLRTAVDDQLNRDRYGFCLLAYDSEYLYFAASVPRVSGIPEKRPVQEGRRHDADLSDFDRVSLFLDIDRDYATCYAIHIDQRGWAAETCWQDVSWNPRMHIAADADQTHWRIELAIGFEELVPRMPQRNSVWAAGILRTMPGVGLQSWTHPASKYPRPETFGLVRFD